jgi:ABC-type transport system substrate-binding protein
VRRSLVLILAAVACSSPAPRDDFVLKIAVVGQLAPLAHDTEGSATVYAQDLVYQAILRPEGAGFASQVLARWERPAGKHLRALVADGLRFSDGSPVEVEDVVRSVQAAGLVARAEGKWLEIEPGRGGLPVDTGLIMATLFKPTPAGDLGTGAFRLVSGDERRLVLERRTRAPRRIWRVELVSVASSREAFAQTLKGEVNAVTNLDDRQVELAEGVPGLRILRARGPHALAIVFNSRRLGKGLRREISEALPVEEIEEVSQGKGCGPTSGRRLTQPLSSGPPLDISVTIVDASVERAGLALRRGLGVRGGRIDRVSIGEVWAARAQHALTVDNALAWPPAVGALYWKTGASANVTGYSNPAYDAAVDAGDFDRAEAELKKDPPVLLLCRQERIAAVDARLKNATLGSWGYLDTLPDWEVSP